MSHSAPKLEPQPLPGKPSRSLGDIILGVLVHSSAAAVLMMMVMLVSVLLVAAVPSMKQFGPSFLITSEWRPNDLERPKIGPDGKVVIEDGETVMETFPAEFGALPVIYGTAASSAISLLFAVPISLATALILVRVAPRFKAGGVLSFLVEFLAAIPSLAYGIWGLFVLAPFLQGTLEPFARDLLQEVPGFRWMFFQTLTIGGEQVERPIPMAGRDMLCGSLVLAIMIIPIITSVARDVLKAVPRAQIEGSLALGSTWWQSSVLMLQYSRSGLFGAVILGLARAAGETMAVAMVIGNNTTISFSPFAPAQTMSSLLANEFAEASTELHRSALLQVALILLVMSLAFNILARWLVVGKGGRPSDAS
jgi:phosphate transport system permease protein